MPTAYVGLAELGLISGVGMFIALIANLTVLPAMLTLMPLKARESADHDARSLVPTERLLERHHRLVLLVALILGLGAAVPGAQARFDFDPLNLKDPDSESMQVLSDISDDPRTGPYAIAVLADSLDQADAIAERARTLPTVDSVLTLSSYLPEQQDEKLEVIS